MAAQGKIDVEIPSDDEMALAANSSRLLAACSGRGDTATLRLIDNETDITVPVKAIVMLEKILNEMAQGNAVTIVPIHAELTTQQAADHLNVSRPFFIKHILEPGKLAFHTCGTRRKILYKDVIAYKEQSLANRNKMMEELAAQSQELGLID